jgi:hypothetical protein
MAIGGKSNEYVCAYAVAIHDHLQPAKGRHEAQVTMLLSSVALLVCQATVLAQVWVLSAQISIVPPWEDGLRVWRPCAHDRKYVGGIVTVELMVVDLAYSVERHQRGNVEVTRQ